MKIIYVLIMAIMFALALRHGLSPQTQKDVATSCQKVCDGIGLDHDYATRSNVFTVKCMCKAKPRLPATIGKP